MMFSGEVHENLLAVSQTNWGVISGTAGNGGEREKLEWGGDERVGAQSHLSVIMVVIFILCHCSNKPYK